MSSTAMPPLEGKLVAASDVPLAGSRALLAGPKPAVAGAQRHWRALESLYASAPISHLFRSELAITVAGQSRITFDVDPSWFHAASAGHGTHLFQDARRCGSGAHRLFAMALKLAADLTSD